LRRRCREIPKTAGREGVTRRTNARILSPANMRLSNRRVDGRRFLSLHNPVRIGVIGGSLEPDSARVSTLFEWWRTEHSELNGPPAGSLHIPFRLGCAMRRLRSSPACDPVELHANRVRRDSPECRSRRFVSL
jgi:hypothetical protein